MTTHDLLEAKRLVEFVDAAPSPYHACEAAGERLAAAGFERLAEAEAWDLQPGSYYVVRGGALVAWHMPAGAPPTMGFRVIGAHTDSPNLRIKPKPDSTRAGWRQLGVEVYGGVLLNSWLDRDLGLSGRAHVRGETGPEERLFRIDGPVLRVPQLAIHLDGDIRTKGLKLNKQTHMTPVWGLANVGAERGFRDLLADALDVAPDDVLAWDAMCHDTTPSCIWGGANEFVSAPRLDNLCSCSNGLSALAARVAIAEELRCVPVLALFDHEEVGSGSTSGAVGPLLRVVLERTVLARGGSREDFHRAVAASACCSADMAHATHPNYAERHEPEHWIELNAGPVIKVNANQRYASDAETEALFQWACREADVPFQEYVNRTDLACGSTIGPLTAANLGMPTVDVGCPQLAMHSSRELCGSHDPGHMVRAMTAFLT
jgi:aspartyl aminopeptidase